MPLLRCSAMWQWKHPIPNVIASSRISTVCPGWDGVRCPSIQSPCNLHTIVGKHEEALPVEVNRVLHRVWSVLLLMMRILTLSPTWLYTPNLVCSASRLIDHFPLHHIAHHGRIHHSAASSHSMPSFGISAIIPPPPIMPFPIISMSSTSV